MECRIVGYLGKKGSKEKFDLSTKLPLQTGAEAGGRQGRHRDW